MCTGKTSVDGTGIFPEEYVSQVPSSLVMEVCPLKRGWAFPLLAPPGHLGSEPSSESQNEKPV